MPNGKTPPTENQWRLLLDISRAIAVTTDIRSLVKQIAEATCKLLQCERSSIFLHEPSTNELWTLIALQSGELRVPASAGIVGAAFSGNQVILVNSAQDDPRFHREIDRLTGYTTRNLLTAPMVNFDGKPVGVIQAINKRSGEYSQEDVPLIQLLADQVGVAVQRHYLQVQAIAAASLRREMDLARSVQQSMFPKTPPRVRGLEVGAWAASASLTGGDAYDLWPRPDGRMGFLLADAAGHGLPPALVVSQVRTLVRAFCDEEPGLNPDAVLAQVNRRIAQDFEPQRFITAFLAYVGGDGVLEWSSAGQGPVFLSKGASEGFAELEPTHPPLGTSATWDSTGPAPEKVAAGAMLIAPSDGMFEAPNRGGEQLGTDRLLAVVEANRSKPVNEVVDRMRQTVQTWQEGQDAADDQTLAVVRWLDDRR